MYSIIVVLLVNASLADFYTSKNPYRFMLSKLIFELVNIIRQTRYNIRYKNHLIIHVGYNLQKAILVQPSKRT